MFLYSQEIEELFEQLHREEDEDERYLLSKRLYACIESWEMERRNSDTDAPKRRGDDPDIYYAQFPCSAREQKREPFLLLRIPKSGNWSKSVCLLAGVERKPDKTWTFLIRTKSGRYKHIHSTACRKCLDPLFEEIQYHGLVLRLNGYCNGTTFEVKGMHLTPYTIPGEELPPEMNRFDLDDGHLQAILGRMFDNPRDRVEGELKMEYFEGPSTDIFESDYQLELLYKLFKDTYTPELRQWAERSLKLLKDFRSREAKQNRNALKMVLSIDWSASAVRLPDIESIEHSLDESFYGLREVKERILEVAAQVRQTGSMPKWGILLNGPAGTGKTSIANAIAEILGLPMVYLDMSLSGDSEALAGSSRIYDNAKAGDVVQKLYAAKTANLVMVLNEIDKVGADKRSHGNPANTLLPLLDGMGFQDNFLEVRIPTNNIFFIATCNDPEQISKPLLDRFLRIDIPGYSPEEKEVILDRYVLPQILRSRGITPEEVRLTEEAKQELLSSYAVEPGVRDLERCCERLVGHYLLEKERRKCPSVCYDAADLRRLLGPGKSKMRYIADAPGLVFSAYTYEGRSVPFSMQALVRPGRGKLEVLHMNSVKQAEYCRIAYENLRSLMPQLNGTEVVLTTDGILPETWDNFVGFAASAAILSALTNIPFSMETLFYGGCDLQGNLYLDDLDLTPLLLMAGRKGFTAVYTGLGAGQKLSGEDSPAGDIQLLELPHTAVLLELLQAEKWSGFERGEEL